MPAPATDEARLALRLGAAALLMLMAAALFGLIAQDVVSGDRITRLDEEIARWLRARADPPLTAWMLIVTHLHSTFAVTVYAALVAAYLALQRRWRRFVAVVACVGGGLVLNVLMKHAFRRARPVLDEPLLTLETFSFPSGHVAGTTLLYGLALVFVFQRTRSAPPRVLAALGVGLAIALVAFTRLYLGVHFLSDVVAGFLEAVVWLTLCLAALDAYWRRQRARAPGPAAPAP